MYGHPDAWHRLCEKLSTIVADYLIAQIDAGVDAVQVFDSWVGALSAADYREFALPHTRRIFEAVGSRVPTIHFGTGTAAILEELREAGGDVIGVDWRIPIDEAWTRIGSRPRRAGQPRPDAAPRSDRRACFSRPTTCSHASATVPVTSSTSVTAFFLPRRSSTCRCSPSTCTPLSRRH